MTKAIELKRGDKVVVEGRSRKVDSVWVALDVVAVRFVNGDSIRWASDALVSVK